LFSEREHGRERGYTYKNNCVFLFIDSYKTRGRTNGIIEKFNLASASPVTTQYIVTHAEIV